MHARSKTVKPKAASSRAGAAAVASRRVTPPSRSVHTEHRRSVAVASHRLQPRGVDPALDAGQRASEAERLAGHIAQTWRLPLPQARRIVRAAYAQASRQQLSPTLILAVVAQESSFQADARSRVGAEGLMQVISRYHPDKLKGLPRDALLQPELNIQVGSQVLAEYLDRVDGRLDTALTLYSGKARAYPQKIQALWSELERVRSVETTRA